MSHFEEFDRRKAEGAARASTGEGRDASLDESGRFPVSDGERRLREALFGLNRAIDPDGGDDAYVRLVRARDEVWSLGIELYGWTD